MALLPFAAIDPRRLDNPDTKGINTVTGQTFKSLEQTQATSPDVPPGVDNGDPYVLDGQSTVAPMYPGDGAMDDGTTQGIQDQINATTGTQSGVINNAALTEQISPQPNVLDNFSSYTYRASLYLITPEQYQALLLNKKKNVSGYQLLIQSGGAPANADGFRGESAAANAVNTTVASATKDAGRNPAFPDDFYFNSITIENVFSGRGSGMAHATCNIKFSIVEPVGITLIDRLYQAVQDFIPKNGAGAVNYAAVTYLMVIRFYGYDSKGNLKMKLGKPGTSDPNAVIEKFIPFRITRLDWSVNGKAVTYEFEGAPVGMMVAAGTRRGTIPHDMQPTARTVGELLGTMATYTDTIIDTQNPGSSNTATNEDAERDMEGSSNPPPKASAAPSTSKTVKAGVLGAMNDFQQELVKGKNKIFKEPDTYKIVWVPDATGKQPIRDAKLMLPGATQESQQTGMAPTPTSDVKSATPERVAKDISSRNFSITAGMQIVQVIDLAIRNSSYIIDQALTIRDPNNPEIESENPDKKGQPVKWYIIEFEAKPKNYDELRSDTAFDITFYVKPYTLQSYNSKYFPMTKFRGVHKSYQYWFTGQNTAVIEYKETLNNLYNITVTGSNPEFSLAEKQRKLLTSSMREIPFYAYQAASTESRQGTAGVGYEESSNLAEDLYSPSDLATATLKIIGDPAWIQQGQFAGGVDTTNLSYNPFSPDGTINFDAGQVLFEIAWQRPQDYDLATGLADPYSNRKNKSRQPGQSRVYIAKKCTSEFSYGKFTQTIEGGLYTFLKPQQNNKAATAAAQPAVNAGFGNGVSEFGEDTKRIGNASTPDAQTATGQESQPAASRTPAAGDYGDGFNSGPSATVGASNPYMVPAPAGTQPSVNENNIPQQTPPAPPLVPMGPPLPPSDGSGIDIGLNQYIARPKINLATDGVPVGPQTVAPPDP